MVVELIGGNDGVAKDLVESSLNSGKSVVTANKALLAIDKALSDLSFFEPTTSTTAKGCRLALKVLTSLSVEQLTISKTHPK